MALERGVYTEDSLKERFTVVEKTARKVAGIGEEGGSLLAYGLSYLQSLMMVDLVQRKQQSMWGWWTCPRCPPWTWLAWPSTA